MANILLMGSINYECKAFQELTLEELYAVMVLRQEVFVVEQNCPYIDADGGDQKGHHLLGKNDDGVLVAYTRLLPKGVTYKEYPSIGRVVTSSLIRRQGAGNLLMKNSIAHCQRLYGQGPIKISAQTYLLAFYQSLGFSPIGEEYLEDGIPHIAMIYGKQ